MAKQWLILMSSLDYGTEIFKYDTPGEQLAGAQRLIKSAQQHEKVDTIRRLVSIIPDPYRGRQKIETFVAAYLVR